MNICSYELIKKSCTLLEHIRTRLLLFICYTEHTLNCYTKHTFIEPYSHIINITACEKASC